jgi:hypothetical protein
MGYQFNSFLVLVSSSKHALQQGFYLLSKDVLRVILVPQDSEVQLCEEAVLAAKAPPFKPLCAARWGEWQ